MWKRLVCTVHMHANWFSLLCVGYFITWLTASCCCCSSFLITCLLLECKRGLDKNWPWASSEHQRIMNEEAKTRGRYFMMMARNSSSSDVCIFSSLLHFWPSKADYFVTFIHTIILYCIQQHYAWFFRSSIDQPE